MLSIKHLLLIFFTLLTLSFNSAFSKDPVSVSTEVKPISKIEIYPTDLEKSIPFSNDTVVLKIELREIFFQLSRKYQFPVHANKNMLEALKRQKAIVICPKQFTPLSQYNHLYLKTIQKAFRNHGFTIARDAESNLLVAIKSTATLNLPKYTDSPAPIDEIVTHVIEFKTKKFNEMKPYMNIFLDYKQINSNKYWIRAFRSDISHFMKEMI